MQIQATALVIGTQITQIVDIIYGYYLCSYGDTAVKISHDTVHQIVSEQHI